ncbi:MAG: phosphoribosyltransferase [Spirochaetota bacterium]
MDERRYRDREDAGHALADALGDLRGRDNTAVYGLARGGVPVAAVVARELGLPLDVLVVRKVGAPANPELAVGAITSVGGMVVNERVMGATGLSREDVEKLAHEEREALRSQEEAIRGAGEPISPERRTVVLVDDGLATGASMEAATKAVRASGASTVIVAVPVASQQAVERVRGVADSVHCLMAPAGFSAVGQWYDHFGQTSTSEVRTLLEQARRFGGRR